MFDGHYRTVNIPSDNSLNVVTVRCGLCANLLSVNLEMLLGKLPLDQAGEGGNNNNYMQRDCESSSSNCSRLTAVMTSTNPMDYVFQRQMQLIQPAATEKRRVPSAYNRFIKEEIRRLKAKDPNISHKEAFSTAAKNWAHFPEIHLGLSIKRPE
ncbi:YABBY2 [Canna indica]|uniref:YABBY2 n=1 Tax=Canna indica TaxID=4628 RepID=A0AAQ3K9I8_9LILI|nr:YABBY2 [Canna indica]